MAVPPPRRFVAVALLASCSGGSPGDGGSAWRSGPAIPARRLEPGVAVLGTRVIVAGGFDTTVTEGLDITKRVDVLDTDAEIWLDPLPPLPVAWTHMNLAGAGDTLYLLGGLETSLYTARGDAWALDPGATQWRSLAPIPAGLERGASGVVTTASHVYLLGGASTTDALASCLDYDIAGDRWSELPALPTPRSHPAAMITGDGTLIAAAGLHTLDATQPYADVWALPPGAAAWQSRGAMLDRARGGCAYAVLGGSLMCAAGEAAQSALHDVDRYDPARDRWTPLEPLPVNRAGTQGAAVGNRFYLPGGAPAYVLIPTDSLFIYTAP